MERLHVNNDDDKRQHIEVDEKPFLISLLARYLCLNKHDEYRKEYSRVDVIAQVFSSATRQNQAIIFTYCGKRSSRESHRRKQ